MFVVIGAASAEGGTDKWSDGCFTTLFKSFWSPLGFAICLACLVDNTMMYIVGIGSTSRVIARLANSDGRNNDYLEIDRKERVDISILPAFVGRYWTATNSPVVAVVLQTLIIFGLVSLNFTFLVQLDSFLNAVSLLLEFLAFIRLRYTRPHAPRP